jgi:hypothetical protein
MTNILVQFVVFVNEIVTCLPQLFKNAAISFLHQALQIVTID